MNNSRFYTNVQISGSKVLVREVVDGIPNMRKEEWSPTLYVKGKPRDTHSLRQFKTLYGEMCYEIKPGTIVDTKEFVEKYKDVSGFEIYGQLNYALQYMNEYRPTQYDYSKISSWGIDIEVLASVDENGTTSFPTPKDAKGEVTLITMINMHNGQPFTFGSKPYSGKDTSYLDCGTEYNLLKNFVLFWEQKKVDIITGWNIENFDMPYLMYRISKILGEEWVRKLSPWGRASTKYRNYKGKDIYSNYISGVSILDYIDMYKKYVLTPQESYALAHIAQEELGTTKLDHSEYASFTEFYQKNFSKYTAYNIIDTTLVYQLDNKLKLIDLVLTMAYSSKINYEDVASPVKLWDAIITNHCLDEGIVMPQQARELSGHLDGAYVKEPRPGWYKNVVSLDATSLYPSIIMTNNISPETYVGNAGYNIDHFLDHKEIDIDEGNIVTPAGAIYRRDIRGVLPTLVEKYMKLRKAAKTEMLDREKEIERLKALLT